MQLALLARGGVAVDDVTLDVLVDDGEARVERGLRLGVVTLRGQLQHLRAAGGATSVSAGKEKEGSLNQRRLNAAPAGQGGAALGGGGGGG